MRDGWTTSLHDRELTRQSGEGSTWGVDVRTESAWPTSENSAVPAGGGPAPESPPGPPPGQQQAQAALQMADRSAGSRERRRCCPCAPATQKIGAGPSPVVFSSSISRCTFYFRESFSIINGATLNMPQTNQIPPLLGQSARRSHGIPKTETSYSTWLSPWKLFICSIYKYVCTYADIWASVWLNSIFCK